MNEDPSTNSVPDDQDLKLPMQILASRFLDRRLELDLTIERVATATKISLPFIMALEKGSMEDLPEPVFARGFIRNICKLYNIDDSDLLLLFDDALATRDKAAADKDEDMARRKRRRWRRGMHRHRHKKILNFGALKPLPFLVLAAGIVLGVTISYYFITRTSGNDRVSESRSGEKSLTESKEKSTALDPNKGDKDNFETIVIPVEKLVASESEQIVELLVKSSLQIKVAKDGGDWMSQVLKPDSYQYRFQSELNLQIQDTDALEISYNGKKLSSLGAEGQSKKLSFKLKDDALGEQDF